MFNFLMIAALTKDILLRFVRCATFPFGLFPDVKAKSLDHRELADIGGHKQAHILKPRIASSRGQGDLAQS
jgi:hypothetical protein